jgi:hypothetical protein
MPRSMKGWRKKWFYLRTDASALLPAFTSGRPIPLPSWGDGVARKDLSKLQPLSENLQQLRQEGLTGMHLLRIFFSCRIQLLRRRRTKIWMYLGSSCPDRPTYEELIAVQVEAQIHKVLDLKVNLNPGPSTVPLRRGIASVKVSKSSPVLASFVIPSFHCAHDLVHGLRGDHDEPWDIDSPSYAARWEVRHASSEEMGSCEETQRKISALLDRWRKGGGWRPPLDLRPSVRGRWKGGQL